MGDEILLHSEGSCVLFPLPRIDRGNTMKTWGKGGASLPRGWQSPPFKENDEHEKDVWRVALIA